MSEFEEQETPLVVLQTETGEQIALPVSALPSDFDPGDSGQIIMVESDEQQQEVVVESSYSQITSSHKKQKRKETLLTRPLNEEDLELEILIIEEPSPPVQEVEVERKPRREYRTKKKVRLAMEKMSKEEAKRDEPKKECTKGPKREIPRRELPKRGIKEKPIEPAKPQPKQQQQPQLQQPQFQSERRTRLSNQCRVATGKSYECNDCDFSTDRINNIILHVKESCPMLKKAVLC